MPLSEFCPDACDRSAGLADAGFDTGLAASKRSSPGRRCYLGNTSFTCRLAERNSSREFVANMN